MWGGRVGDRADRAGRRADRPRPTIRVAPGERRKSLRVSGSAGHTGLVTDRARTGGRIRTWWAVAFVLIGIVSVFFVIRLLTDVPYLATGSTPAPDSFESRYVAHPVLAYAHIVPGMVYLLGAVFQLSRRFRVRHLAGHRRTGRVLLVAGLVSGVLAVVVGVWFPFGGPAESAAGVVFGLYFVTALALAFRAVRNRDVGRHRRWMIRAFAVAVGVGTIRIWIGLFQATGLLSIGDGTGTTWFGLAFWLAFVLHALAAEAYLAARPARRRAAPAAAT